MRWIRGIDESQIVTDCGRYKINKHAATPNICTKYIAWAPKGTRPEGYNPDGRALIGAFDSAEDARAACEEWRVRRDSTHHGQ